MQFLSGSLDAISKNYSNDFKITRSNFPEESWDLISQKGVLPYNYLDNFEKLNETKLPEFQEFDDVLKLENAIKKIMIELLKFGIYLNIKQLKIILLYI